jgi:DNA-binding response OmpR family regulator
MSQEANPPVEPRPTIFLIEEDDDARPILVKNLRRLGYRVLVAASLEDAREWMAGEAYIHADMVLINLVGRAPEEVLRAGRELREHSRYDGHTPLVVMPEKYGDDLEGTEVSAGGKDWFFYGGGEPDQMKDFLARLAAESPGKGA